MLKGVCFDELCPYDFGWCDGNQCSAWKEELAGQLQEEAEDGVCTYCLDEDYKGSVCYCYMS